MTVAAQRTAFLLLPNDAGNPRLGGRWFCERFWQPLIEKADVPYRSDHATRYSFATWALEGGERPERVQLYMGHASLKQTLGTYYHALIGNRDELEGMMSALRGLGQLALPPKQ